MNCQILYTTVLTVALGAATAVAEVKVIDHTEKSRAEMETSNQKFPDAGETAKSVSKPKADQTAKKQANPRVPPKYVLEDRETGKVISFSEASILDTIDSLRAVDVPMDQWHSCSAKPGDQGAPEKEPSLEELEKSLEVALLIESLADIPAPELTDSQRDWVKGLSPCAPDMRLHLKALSLILTNYKIITKPEA